MIRVPPLHHVSTHLLEKDIELLAAVQRFGTPLYVYDLPTFLFGWMTARSIVSDAADLYYSVKANPNFSLIVALAQLEARFEVASVGELQTVLRAGVDAQRILFVGPGKTTAALEEAIAAGVGVVVAESQAEFTRINDCAELAPVPPVKVALRINPGNGAGRIAMAGTTQFGMSPENALSLLCEKYPRVHIIGIHGYLATGLLDWGDIKEHSRVLLEVAFELQQRCGRPFEFVDVGGGFGIPYFGYDYALDTCRLREALGQLFQDFKIKLPNATFAMELGRFIAGPAGIFLASIIDVKDVAGQCFAVLDGGTNVMGLADRYIGQRALPFRILGKQYGREDTPLTLVGPLCTPTDRLAVEQVVPRPSPGQVVAFYQAGAYGLTAAPGLFLGHGFPAEVLLDNGRMKLIRERLQTMQILDGLQCDQPWVNIS